MATVQTTSVAGVRIAVEGCGHGTLNAIYETVNRSCKERGWDGVDAVIIGGDFQAVRNPADLTVMSVPAKYRELGDFHEYYSGARKAPYLTLFIAGNHEAASYLWELYYGGWVAPNIYYLGAANIVRLGPIRIAGMSGIWKGHDYRRSHHERLPFSQSDVRTFYHVREIDVRKLLQVRTQVDIGISHDWPRAIERYGDERALFRMKPDFERESKDGSLGNPAAEYVMDRLRPPYWFSAHMHCKFAAIKTYTAPGSSSTEKAGKAKEPQATDLTDHAPTANPDEIDLDLDPSEEAGRDQKPVTSESRQFEASNAVPEDLRAQLPESFAAPQSRPRNIPGQPVPSGIQNTVVRFLALDKCLPGRKFLQLCEVLPFDSSNLTSRELPLQPRFKLRYDPEWLAITRVFAKFLTMGDPSATTPPDLGEAHYQALIDAEREWVEENIVQKGALDVPDNFSITAAPHVPGDSERVDTQPDEYTNPQIEAFCTLVGVPNLWGATEEERLERKKRGPPSEQAGGRDGNRGGRGGSGAYHGGRGGSRGRGGHGRGRGRGRGWIR